MSSTSPQPLGKIIKEVLEELGLAADIDRVRAMEAWAEVAGPQINAVTERVWVAKNKLYVRLTSPVWRQELHLQRRQWCKRLNEHLGKEVIEEVVFR